MQGLEDIARKWNADWPTSIGSIHVIGSMVVIYSYVKVEIQIIIGALYLIDRFNIIGVKSDSAMFYYILYFSFSCCLHKHADRYGSFLCQSARLSVAL